MQFFKKDRCLLVDEDNHYTGLALKARKSIGSLNSGRTELIMPTVEAASASAIADYWIAKMINPSSRDVHMEEAMEQYVKKLAEIEVERVLKQIDDSELDGW
jgi:hypothetical protein